jgi:hypothetical protein
MLVALNNRMQTASDIRNHHELLPLIPHARVLSVHLPDVLSTTLLSFLGRFNYERSAYAEAEADYFRTLEAGKWLLGEEHPDTLTSMNNLALTLRAQGDHAGARAIQEEVLAVRRRVLGAVHPDTLASMNNLGVVLVGLNETEAARALVAEALPIALRKYGTEPEVSKVLMRTASALGMLPPSDAQPQS